MIDPTPPTILDCGHVEHPPGSGQCQTLFCPNKQPRPRSESVAEWLSGLAIAGLLIWVEQETGQPLFNGLLEHLPRLVQ